MPNCADVGVLGVLPGVLGTLAATEAIKLIVGAGTPLIGRLLTYDALELRFGEFRFALRPDCAVCGAHPSILAPADPEDFCTREELARVPRWQPRELAAALATGSPRLALIDVREPAEFATGHLAGAINVPVGSIEGRLAELPRDRTLVFLRRSGARSLKACAFARRAGLAPLQLEGGLAAYRTEDPSLPL